MLNPFFLQGSKSEQSLVQDLINEQLKIYGVEVYYLPRQFVTEKTVMREVIESNFNNAYPIEAYLENVEGYSDNPTILSKFGIQALNEITLTISRERFKTYISPLIQSVSNIKLSSRPKEGDLIYFPLGKRLFEIKYVEHEKPFYQLQGLYTYQLRCELFQYEDEIIDTNIDDIDNLISGDDQYDIEKVPVGHLINLNLVGAASTATATISLYNGGVRYVSVTNRGGGYTTTPTVGFSSAPSGGKTATAIANMIGGIVVCNDNVNPNAKSVQSVYLTNSGYGYTVAPLVKFTGGGGSGAAGTAYIGDGIVGVVTITSGGSGYVFPPSITFSGISSVSAAATAIVSAAGTISAIYIVNTGLGYTSAPTITIGAAVNSGIGTFKFNELVTGSQSGTTAVVKSWNSTTAVLQVSNRDGDFAAGELILGSESGASYYLRNTESYYPTNDGYADNDEIQVESDKIIDFSEVNPFGMP